jgi:3-hydroxybutyryl-CoA dehydrogenase
VTAPLRRLAVVGAGSMGAQIAQQAALRGIDVRLQDTSEEQLRKAVESNRGHLVRHVEKGRLSAEAAEAAIGRVRTTTDLAEAAHDADLIIEAVFEDLGVKRSIFGELDRLAPGDAVLASNSSTMAISKIADATNRPPLGSPRRSRGRNCISSTRCW